MERLTWLVEGIASGGPALVAGLLALGYGAAGAFLIGVRSRLLILGVATPVGIALLGISAQLAGMLGIAVPFGLHALVGFGIAALAGVIHARTRRRADTPVPSPNAIVWIGIAIGVLATVGVWTGGIGDFALPPQANDDIWHGYLVQRLTQMPIVTADTVAPTLADSQEPILFYQYGLHLLWAVAHSITGISVAEVMNGGWMLQVAVLLPVGGAALAWRLFPDRASVAFWAAAVTPGVVVLPYLTNGVLPYTASLAMIPGFVAALVTYVRGELRLPAIVPALGAVGIFLTHPSGAIVGAIVAGLVTLEVLATRAARVMLMAAIRRVATVATMSAVLALPWLLAAGDRGLGDLAGSAEVPDIPGAIWLVATLGTPWTSAQPVIAALVLIGVAATIYLRRGISLAVAWLVFAVLFVGTVTGLGPFISITQAWHGQWYRIAAALGIVVPVLAGLGTATLVGLAHERAPAPTGRFRMGLVALISLVVTLGAAYGAAQGQGIVRSSWHASGLVTSTDVAVFRQLAELTGSGDRVFNSPRDGSSWMYAMYGVVPTQPYIYLTPRRSWDLVNDLSVYRNRSVVCSRLARDGVTHAIVKSVTGDIPGLEAYDVAGFVQRHQDLFDEVARSPTAVAYEVDQEALSACLGP